MRLDRFLAEATGLTRSTAKKVLHQGLVEVDGQVVKKGDVQIQNQQVLLDGKLLSLRPPCYLMMNKPVGYISSSQSEAHESVLNLLPEEFQESLHCAGRLDVDTTGLLLLTDDGQWSHRVTSPKKELGKTYRVHLAEDLDPNTAEAFATGVALHGESKLTKPAQLEVVTPREVVLTIFEGKYHQVKRMFAAVGNKVEALHRERIGTIVLDSNLQPGQWRPLTDDEIKSV